MSLVNQIRNRLVTSYHHAHFNRVARGVLKTRPLRAGDLPFVTLSMVQHRDVLAYLVAIKTFAHHAPSARVVVVCDPTITLEDRACLKQHVPHIELREAVEFRHSAIPVGGTWERLSAITTYVNEAYVVQLDADTVCTAPLIEVCNAVQQGHGFVLGEVAEQRILSLAETAKNSENWSDRHIQAVAEKTMESVLGDRLYIRGCSGFTGFPSGSSLRTKMLDFSSKMAGRIGARWSEWGTEQVASNFLVANSLGTQILPFPKYSTPPKDRHDVAFHHYIGHIRFRDSRYANAAELALRQLQT